MRRLTQRQVIESRIREIRRKILHTYDSLTRKLYKEHIEHLEKTLYIR